MLHPGVGEQSIGLLLLLSQLRPSPPLRPTDPALAQMVALELALMSVLQERMLVEMAAGLEPEPDCDSVGRQRMADPSSH